MLIDRGGSRSFPGPHKLLRGGAAMRPTSRSSSAATPAPR